jgi:Mg2+ and Co2+ transporter CorA
LIDVPLMKSDWGFDIVFSLMIIMAVFMIVYFKKKKWF